MTGPLVAMLESSHVPILLVTGFAVFGGTIGGRIFQWARIPQVVGYITIGLVLGRSGLNVIGEDEIGSLLPFNYFALGVIGFKIGGELHRDVFRRHGKQFFAILFAEGFGAFIFVSLATGAVTYLALRDLPMAVALGLTLGAISSATAPAATVDVLWEYKTRGILTTTVFAVVALDDALALFLFSVAASIAVALTGQGSAGFLSGLGRTVYELLGAVALGVLAGALLNGILRMGRDRDKALTFTVGALALVLGAAAALGVDLILTSMSLGMTLANLAPRRSHSAFETVDRFAPPIYVLFFVIVGARVNLTGMPGWAWGLAVCYVIGRTGGKMLGAALGARAVHAAEVVRKYLGLCLFSQAGVAIGLAIMAGGRFPDEMANTIIMVVTTTTFLVQIIGPPCVKLAAVRSREAGLDITEEDLMTTYKVRDVMDRSAPSFTEATTVAEILKTIAATEATSYPVVDEQGDLSGLITLQQLKQMFATTGMAQWTVAYDLMQPVPDSVTADTPLPEAMTRMSEQELEYLPVMDPQNQLKLVGLLDQRALNRQLSQEVLRRHQLADGPAA